MTSGRDGRVRITIGIDRDLIAWIEKNIEAKRFATKTHAIEYALTRLRQESDGVCRARWWEHARLNEKGEVCDPIIPTAEELAMRMFPQYPAVKKPAELVGWALSPGLDNCDGYDFPYVYLRRVGKFKLEIATDPSQIVLKTAVIKIDEGGRACQDDFEAGIYDLHQRTWRHGSTIGLHTSIYDLGSFAAALVEHAKRLNEI